MKQVNAPCPVCDHTPVNRLDLVDGEIWFCPGCGYEEITAGVDIEAQLAALAEYDPEIAAAWRTELGI